MQSYGSGDTRDERRWSASEARTAQYPPRDLRLRTSQYPPMPVSAYAVPSMHMSVQPQMPVGVPLSMAPPSNLGLSGMTGESGQAVAGDSRAAATGSIAEQQSVAFSVLLSVSWLFIMLLFGFGTEFDASILESDGAMDPATATVYLMYNHVAIMLLIGIGFLMTFLHRYAYGALGYTFLITLFTVLWGLLVSEWLLHCAKDITDPVPGFTHCNQKLKINVAMIINGMFAAATVMISFGGLLGKVTILQFLVMAIIEVCFYSVNLMIGIGIFKAIDVGGGMMIHMFGGYFGLCVCMSLRQKGGSLSAYNKSSVDHDIFSMVGTLFLWICWPTFNAVFAGKEQHLMITNTILGMIGSGVAAFLFSGLLGRGKFDMVHVQNATLAGGVAMANPGTMLYNPAWAIFIGSLAGAVSVLGYKYLSGILSRSIGLHDTCGIHNLHGLPSIIGAIAAIASADIHFSSHQAQMNAAALAVTLGIATVGGLVTGMILKLMKGISEEEMFKDDVFWEGELEPAVYGGELYSIHGVKLKTVA